MPEFFDYDPLTGVTQYHELNDEGKSVITSVSDVEPLLDWCKQNRNDPEVTRHGIKESWWCYAKLGPIQMIQLRQAGFDIHSPDESHQRAIFKYVDEHFPAFKMTTGKHGTRRQGEKVVGYTRFWNGYSKEDDGSSQ